MQDDNGTRQPIHINHILIIVTTIMTVFATAVTIVALRAPEKGAAVASEDVAPEPLDETLVESDASENAGAVAEIAHLKKVDHDCPPPTKKQGSQCVLEKDEVISETIDLGSFTHLNCKGFKLSPATRGVQGNINTSSNPEVGVVMRETYGAKLQNCVLDGFDFGIFVLKNKLEEEMKEDAGAVALLGNKILGNTVVARFVGISLMEADNTEVKDNDVVFTTASGRGIQVGHDSDMNAVRNNTIVGKVALAGQTRRFPGPTNTLTNPNVTNRQSDGIIVAEVRGGEPTLVNFIVGGNLYQFTTTNWLAADDSLTEADLASYPSDNVFEGNEISYEAPDSVEASRITGMSMRGPSLRSVFRGNDLSKVGNGIIQGTVAGGNRRFPGLCNAPGSQRACLTNADCMIQAVDNGVSQGTCTGSVVRSPDWVPVDATIEDNELMGPIALGVEVSGRGTMARNNRITGPSLPDGASQWAGIFLRGKALESSTVTGNSVTGVGRALRLEKSTMGSQSAAFFGAKIYRNDFVGTDVSIHQGTGAEPYILQTELSQFGLGNHWGRSCDDSDGFRDFGEPDESGRTDSPLALITDSHPYGVPVAALTSSQLPETCK